MSRINTEFKMKIRYLPLLIFLLPPCSALAQGTNTPVTETAPPTVIYITNEAPTAVITIPVISTNAAAPAKSRPLDNSGTSLLGAFGGQSGGKFSISGRTLRLPALSATPHAERDWRRNLDFGMNQTKGNTETLRYSLGLDALKEEDADLFRLRAKGLYGESDGNKDTENAYAGFRYERLLTPQIYALGNLDWITDTIADLRYRVTAIASPGWRLIRTEETLINLEAGAGYIREKKAVQEEGYAAGRAAITIERVANAHVILWCAAEYLPKLADPNIFFINAEAGAASYITRDLSLNICYQERYDSSPVEGKKNADTILATAISLNF